MSDLILCCISPHHPILFPFETMSPEKVGGPCRVTQQVQAGVKVLWCHYWVLQCQ